MQNSERRPAGVPDHFEPVFDDRYDEITKPNVELRVPAYFMKHWSPQLSPGAALLYLQLRLMCWYDEKNPKNTRDYCWPKQATLANLIGSSRRTVQRHLTELEGRGLIRRSETRYYDNDKGKKLRGVDVYQVPYRLPVTPDHAAKAAAGDIRDVLKAGADHSGDRPLVPESQTSTDLTQTPTGPKRQNDALVTCPPPRRQSGVGTAAPNLRTEVVPEVSKNVQNVAPTASRGLASHPVVRAMTPEEKAARKKLARAIGQQLVAMNGKLARRRGVRTPESGLAQISDVLKPRRDHGDCEQHKDYGFHWLVAHFMPGPALSSALVATEDAVEDEIQGNRALATTPDRYFTGVVRRICTTEGIELPGVRWNAPREA